MDLIQVVLIVMAILGITAVPMYHLNKNSIKNFDTFFTRRVSVVNFLFTGFVMLYLLDNNGSVGIVELLIASVVSLGLFFGLYKLIVIENEKFVKFKDFACVELFITRVLKDSSIFGFLFIIAFMLVKEIDYNMIYALLALFTFIIVFHNVQKVEESENPVATCEYFTSLTLALIILYILLPIMRLEGVFLGAH